MNLKVWILLKLPSPIVKHTASSNITPSIEGLQSFYDSDSSPKEIDLDIQNNDKNDKKDTSLDKELKNIPEEKDENEISSLSLQKIEDVSQINKQEENEVSSEYTEISEELSDLLIPITGPSSKSHDKKKKKKNKIAVTEKEKNVGLINPESSPPPTVEHTASSNLIPSVEGLQLVTDSNEILKEDDSVKHNNDETIKKVTFIDKESRNIQEKEDENEKVLLASTTLETQVS